MDSEFAIPLTKDDLLCPAEGSYVVQEVYSARGLPGKISDAVSVLNGGSCNILGQFDVFFSVVKNFAELNNQLKFDCWKCLNKALNKQMSDLINILEENDIERDTKKAHRNTLKMLSYLLTQFAEEFEAEDCKPSAAATPGRKRGKSKKSASALPFDWSEVKKDFLNITTQLLEINIVSLWEPPVVEEEFVNAFANCCYKFLENPVINREKNIRDSILNVLAILVRRYNQSLSVGVKVIQLLQHFEHLIAPMAQLVQICASEHGMRNIVVDMLREIGRIDPKDLERDASGTRCYSDFLVELASRIPEYILPNISLLLCHLDTEPYSMRNGVLGVMGKLVILRLSQDDLAENLKNTRDQILDHLENHIHDVHAYVRSKVLQIWQNICREKAIPLARQQNLLSLVIGRLTDISSNVRKNAIIFLKEYLMNNAFGSKFPLEEVKKRLEEEKEKLRKMDPGAVDDDDQVSEAARPEELKRWLELEGDVKRVVENHWEVKDIVDEDGEHVEFQGDVNEALEFALMNVKRQLVSGDYVKALAVLKAALVTWPDNEMFVKTTTEESEHERADEAEAARNKEDVVDREMELLKTIFLNPEFGPVSNLTEEDERTKNRSNQNGNTNPDTLVNEVSKQQIVIQYLKDYLSFHTQYQQALMIVCRLLGSQVSSDVHESIEFVVVAYEFGLKNALLGVRRMLSLVWSKDNDIKTKVIDAYTRLYLNPQAQEQRSKAEAIVKNLFALLSNASIGDLTSLDELVYKLMKANLLPNNVIHLLWEKFAMKDRQTTPEESKAALKLLGMLARGKQEIVKSNIEVLVNIGLGERAKDDALLVRDTCTILLKLAKTEEKIRDDKQSQLRFSSDHAMFLRLNEILVNTITSPVQGMWVPMAEGAINVIYNLAEHPDRICCNLIKNLIEKVLAGDEDPDRNDEITEKAENDEQQQEAPISCPSFVLARLLAAAGHVALQQVIHLEASVLGEIKRRERLKEDEKGNKKKTTSTSVEQTPRNKEAPGETLEDEMGLTGATAEDAEAEYIKKICDHEIVTGGNHLLSLLGSFIVTICNNPIKFPDLQLQTAASLALSKFMLVSAEFCENNLQLLFTILEKSRYEVIRSNTIIALGDLTPRFPNLIEPWTANLYARLRDDSSQVRMNTMKIMTRLILNDMVKVKGQISEIATCLEDDDPRIAELAKSFFAELAKKGNAVYNILPDVISRLSDPETGIPEAPFRNIMSYLFSFIQKDRQCESLVEKLCHRFRATKTDRQWIDLSFCLAQLSYNERSLRKLQENFACFQCTLSNEEVYSFFNIIIGKCKKMAKPEMKAVVEELELRITTCHEKGAEDDAGYERANQASAAARVLVGKAVNTPANKKARSTKGRTPASRRRRKNDSESEVLPKPHTGRKSTRKTRKKVIEFSDSDDDDWGFDEDWGEFEKENVNVRIESTS